MSETSKPQKTLAEAAREFNEAMNECWKLIEAEYLRAAQKILDIWKKQSGV